MDKKNDKPVMGIPYNPNNQYVGNNNNTNDPYRARKIPPKAIVGDPKGVPIKQTIYRDTPAPINCTFCGGSGVTKVRSKISLAAVVGCMMPFMLGVCFLCPTMDCLWHKYHFCPHCNEKLAQFEKNDACAVVDPPNWLQKSFALPA